MYTFDANIVSDLHKDARGFRPSEYFWEEWSQCGDDTRQLMWDSLIKELEQANAEQARREAISIGDFERGVRQNLALGAGDRATAIRWMLDGVLNDHDLWYGGGYACYLFNLPYSFRAELDPVVAQIQQMRNKEVDSVAV
jgi:hypothetical protein